ERLMARAPALRPPAPRRVIASPTRVRVGVAFDDAFCFYYAENLELLEEAGADIVTFSPLEDRSLPRDLDALYLGGGVSEMYIPRLAGSQPFLNSFRHAHAQGVPIFAECGGLLFCTRSVQTIYVYGHVKFGILSVDIVLA